MKLLHLGDLHIGKRLGEFDLIEDQKYILNQVIELAKAESVDAVMLAGDIYDKSIPSENAVSLFDYFLRKLSGEKIQTFVISGNHDSDERLQFGSSLFEKNGVFISAKYEGILYKKELQDAYGKINVYLLPFMKASVVRKYFPDEEIVTYDDAVRVVLRQARINEKERNVIVAHQFVAGRGIQPILAGSEGMAVQSVGLVEQIGMDVFDLFDYVALGHIHSPQKIGREEVRYAGSMLKYSFSEVHSDKSVPIVTMKEKGNVIVEQHPLKPLRDLRHLKGKLEVLLKKENISDQDDYIYVTLTDEDPINDAMGIIKQYYPRTVKLDYDNSHTRETMEMDGVKLIENKSFSDLIREFYEMMYGCQMSEEEMKVMREVAGEAGVADETG
ncbi:MAG: exonuclease SbcCD subunit D [Eubacteriales bacterium]|nr:exonuclease SbcCD subunit D [Eubacteriales bacterium]